MSPKGQLAAHRVPATRAGEAPLVRRGLWAAVVLRDMCIAEDGACCFAGSGKTLLAAAELHLAPGRTWACKFGL